MCSLAVLFARSGPVVVAAMGSYLVPLDLRQLLWATDVGSHEVCPSRHACLTFAILT